MTTLKIDPCPNISGQTFVPGDKSISHRALMFASIAAGESRIKNLLEGHDCFATLQVMRSLGVHISLENNEWLIKGVGKNGLKESEDILDCKNSGTTIRLLAGLLSGMPFFSVLDGTEQIKKRPMGRVVAPLSAMGAKISGRNNNNLAPLAIAPASLLGMEHVLEVKSAQVKSALILAGLFAKGETIIARTKNTRDHSELLLSFMGAEVKSLDDSVVVSPLKGELAPLNLDVPGDISSAAFLIVAGVLLAQNGLVLRKVGINKTRTGIIDALVSMGADIKLASETSVAGEQVADIIIKKSALHGAEFSGDHIVRMIDEIPVLALAATQSEGVTVIKDASELKVKESNRITRVVELLNSVGADVTETDDGMIIKGPSKLAGGKVDSYFDHRLALFMSIAGLVAQEPIEILNAHVTDDSFPGFVKTLSALGAKISEA